MVSISRRVVGNRFEDEQIVFASLWNKWPFAARLDVSAMSGHVCE